MKFNLNLDKLKINFKKSNKSKTKKQNSSQKPNFIRNMLLTGQLHRLIVMIITIICVSIFIILALLRFVEVFGGPISGVDFIIMAILSGAGIFGMYEYMRVKKIYKIDTIFPDFVRDLAESRRAGMTFTKAILFASRGNYGILTPEIQKISQQVSWGSSVTDALIAFSKRVNTRSIKRTISLIIEASKSGGNVADVLDVAAKDAREIKMLEAERKANMASYVVVIYVGMLVFLAIILILSTSFIPAMIGEGGQGMQGVMGGGSAISQSQVTSVFFFAVIVQSFGSGFVAGVFEDGQLMAGIKHMFVMVLIGWLSFKILLGV